MTDSRANWFSPQVRQGPERKCLFTGCPKRFHNAPGEDYRTCRDHRKITGALGCSVAGTPRASSRRSA